MNKQKTINKDLKESLKESQEEIRILEFSSKNTSHKKAETLELYIISKEKFIASLELEIKQTNERMQRKEEPKGEFFSSTFNFLRSYIIFLET